MTKRLFSLLLALLMIFPMLLSSCSQKESETGEEGSEEQQDDALRKYMAITIYGIASDSMTEESLAAVEQQISNYCVARYKTSIDLRLYKASEYDAALDDMYEKFAQKDEEKRIAAEEAASSSKAEKEALSKMSKEEKRAYQQKKRIEEKEAKEEAEKAKKAEEQLVEEGKDRSVAADEVQMDIIFLPTIEAYYNAVDSEQLVDIRTYLSNRNKLITDYVYPSFIGGATVDGGVYGIPTNRGIETNATYLVVNKALSEKYNVDWDSFHSLKDLEEVFARMKAQDPGVTPIYGDFGPEDVTFYHPNGMDAGNMIAVNASTLWGDAFSVTSADGSFNKSTTAAFDSTTGNLNNEKNLNTFFFARWKSEWRKAGYLSDTNKNFFLTVAELSEDERQAKEDEGYLTVLYKGAPFTTEEALGQGVYGISSRCADPERAMEILQLMYTDTTFHNLFAFGLEDVNYVVNSDGKTVTVIDDSYKIDLFNTGNPLLSYVTSDMDPDYVAKAKAKNLKTRLDPFLGFRFDWTEEKNEEWLEVFQKWHDVVGDRFDRLMYGVADPDKLYKQIGDDTGNTDLVGFTYSNMKDNTTLYGNYKTQAGALARVDAEIYFTESADASAS